MNQRSYFPIPPRTATPKVGINHSLNPEHAFITCEAQFTENVDLADQHQQAMIQRSRQG